MNWTRKETKIIAETPYMKLSEDTVSVDEKKEYRYWVEYRQDAVMIIPVRVDLAEPTYVLVEQYRYPTNMMSLEFPAGHKNPGESSRDAAMRELKEETGYEPLALKLLYSVTENPSRSSSRLFVYLAVVQGAPLTTHLEEVERDAKLNPVLLTTSELHKKVLDNTIFDQGTLSALAVMILQNPKASEYLTLSGIPQEDENDKA